MFKLMLCLDYGDGYETYDEDGFGEESDWNKDSEVHGVDVQRSGTHGKGNNVGVHVKITASVHTN